MIWENRRFRAGIGIFGSFGSYFYGMGLLIVGGDFFVMKIIRETTEIKVLFSNLIKLSKKFGSL
jgi:hypothetical protein